MTTPTPADAISAVEAFPLAGITYRQLDYWARRGWVQPSIEAGTGRPGRRLYSPDDVIRLAALGSFGRAGVDVGRLGPRIAGLALPEDTDYLIVLGPNETIDVVTPADLRRHLSNPANPGCFAVFDPASLRRRFGRRVSAAEDSRHSVESRIA